MLSEDEREAIERLKAQLNFWKKQNIKNSDCEIILNLITKLQKENETTCKLNANMSKRHLNDIFKIKNYEKQTDLMAEEISNNLLNTCPYIDYDIDLDCKNRCSDNFKECWKKYFERKARDERN